MNFSAASRSRLSESSRNCPDTTTVSPGSRPDSTSSSLCSARRPMVTSRASKWPGFGITKTTERVPVSITATSGTSVASSATLLTSVTVAYMPGFSS